MLVRLSLQIHTLLLSNTSAAPRPILQHIVIAQAAATPNIHDAITTPLPTRESVPKELLKHRFLPCGALSAETNADSVDMDAVDTSPRLKEKMSKKEASSDKSNKKRKVEAVSPSKTSKKLKL